MRKGIIISGVILLVLISSGCVGGGQTTSATITPAPVLSTTSSAITASASTTTPPAVSELSLSTDVTTLGVSVLPAATSSETYTATIKGHGGTAPYTCRLVSARIASQSSLSLANNCGITGRAPLTSATKIIPFKAELTDANGQSAVFDMHITVNPPKIKLELPERIEAKTGESFEYSFCSPNPGLNCAEGSTNPTGGNPPYTFTVSGQPMGLIMNLNGVLSGTIPEQATIKEYSVEVCVKDTKGDSDCGNTKIDVTEGFWQEGEWTGTVLAKRSFIHPEGYYKDGIWTYAEFNVEIVEEADFSFLIGSFPYEGALETSMVYESGTGKSKVTTTITGPCNKEFIEEFDIRATNSMFLYKKRIESLVEQGFDITPPIEDKFSFGITETHSKIKFKCPDLPEVEFYIDGFGHSYDITAKDGVIIDIKREIGCLLCTKKDDEWISDVPADIRFEIHKGTQTPSSTTSVPITTTTAPPTTTPAVVSLEDYYFKGVEYILAEEYSKAISELTKVIELDPNYAEAYNSRALSYQLLEEWANAISDYSKFIELEPNDADAHFYRGNSYFNLDKYAKAISDYDKSIELDPTFATTYYNRGVTYKKLGETEKAQSDFDKATELGYEEE